MTAREVWEGMLTELSKVNAPSMLLSDFNYFFNKAINQYINKRYSIYDISQQTTDDLRVLKSTAVLEPHKITETEKDNTILNKFLNVGAGNSLLFGATYEVYLPLDYLHMLNCVCIYEIDGRYKCYNNGDYVLFAATKLTADSWSKIVNDYYNRPLPERPYYYIHNVNTSNNLPTNPIGSTETLATDTRGTDSPNDYSYTGGGNSNLPRAISIEKITNKSVVEKEAGQRYGNASSVRCEIRYGHDDSVFKLKGVLVDYIKSPLVIRLTQELVNLTQDTSLIMEFPDYACHEIINELIHLVMENIGDPRLANHQIVTTSIANPAQALTPQQTTPRRRSSLTLE